MKKSKFTEAQFVSAIKQSATVVAVAEICRKMGITDATFYNCVPDRSGGEKEV